jgi:hypothetical protein
MRKLRAFWEDIEDGKKRIIKPMLGVLIGGSLGFAYYWTVGCSSGGCPITSDPWISTFWGAAIGGLAAA